MPHEATTYEPPVLDALGTFTALTLGNIGNYRDNPYFFVYFG
jgi:hypothetical protein